ncbi:MAG TPA: DUF3040 domain-containing protein [Actinomycetaceae bacterium]|nr:DUF3040 domain-containing protein [Actinomycetaceae bacterium]
MPLSEYEQRVLQQMEQQLRSDDPRFVSQLAAAPKFGVRRIILGILALIAGLILLVAGVASSLVWLGVLGFIAMLGGVMLAISKPRKGPEPGPGARPAKTRGSTPSGPGFMDRMENRWDQRRDDLGR